MKTLISTALLSVGWLIAYPQPSPGYRSGTELSVGYVRETFHLRDRQVSPMRYVSNLNGLKVEVGRRWATQQFRISLQAGVGDLIAPTLGVRSYRFSPEKPDEAPLLLVPTLYRLALGADYFLRTQHREHGGRLRRETFWGLGLRNQGSYADGLALTTWAMNTASLTLLFQNNWNFGRRHRLALQASVPLLTAVSRIPYSNVVGQPGRSNVSAFFQHTSWELPPRFLNPQVGLDYRFQLSSRLATLAAVRYNWLRYPDPQRILAASQSASVSFVYSFTRQQP